MKMILVNLIALSISLSLHAAKEVGNGGDAVEVDGKLYLLDLLEYGDPDNPYNDLNIEPLAKDLARLDALDAFNDQEQIIDKVEFARKIAEIRKVSTILAETLVRTLSLYEWRYVRFPLVDVGDENTKVDLPRVQIAIRQRKSVFSSRSVLKKLEPSNRVPFIFHELFYALVKPKEMVVFESEITSKHGSYSSTHSHETTIEQKKVIKYQESSVAREITAYVFSSRLLQDGKEGLEELLKTPDGEYYLPHGDHEVGYPTHQIEEDPLITEWNGISVNYSTGRIPGDESVYSGSDSSGLISSEGEIGKDSRRYLCHVDYEERYRNNDLWFSASTYNVFPKTESFEAKYNYEVMTFSLESLPLTEAYYVLWKKRYKDLGKALVKIESRKLGKKRKYKPRYSSIYGKYYSLGCDYEITKLINKYINSRKTMELPPRNPKRGSRDVPK